MSVTARLHAERVEPEVRVVDPVAVVGVLVLARFGEVLDLLYRLLGVHLPALGLGDQGEYHLGQLILAGAAALLFFLFALGSLDQRLDLLKAGLGSISSSSTSCTTWLIPSTSSTSPA